MIDSFNTNNIVEYALLLQNSTTIAKVGYYLEQRKQELQVKESQLRLLENHRPASVHYMDNAIREKCQFVSRWNLMIPKMIIQREWENFNDTI